MEAIGSAVQLNEEGEHSFGNRPFNPLYPVYNFNSTQSPQQFLFAGETSNPQQPVLSPGSISDASIIQKY